METTSAGAIPAATGAMPVQTPPAAPETEPATGTAEALGEGGTRALQTERDARKAAEKTAKDLAKELDTLRNASASDSEKALKQARDEGGAAVLTKADAKVRKAEVKAALMAVGCTDVALLAGAPEFADLVVDEDGNVEGLSQAVIAAKAAHGSLFLGKRPSGSADAGSSGAGAPQTSFTRTQLRDPKFFRENKDAIMAAQAAGRITG